MGWIGAGSRSPGNGGSQFPPIDVAARAGRAGRARGLHKPRRAPRARAAGRCSCEAMGRLTGARPAATHRWGSTATAFLLLLLTVQAGKGGRSRGRRGGVPGSQPRCPRRVLGWGWAWGGGLVVVTEGWAQLSGSRGGTGRAGCGSSMCPWWPGGAWGRGLGSPLPGGQAPRGKGLRSPP